MEGGAEGEPSPNPIGRLMPYQEFKKTCHFYFLQKPWDSLLVAPFSQEQYLLFNIESLKPVGWKAWRPGLLLCPKASKLTSFKASKLFSLFRYGH
jgi:hypothetical protein